MKIPHKHAEVIKAWADGAEIQFRKLDAANHLFHKWRDYSKVYPNGDMSWYPQWEYRIKPEPKPDTILYAELSSSDGCETHWHEYTKGDSDNVKATFDGETGKLKHLEILR